jgi:hypothetical protein
MEIKFGFGRLSVTEEELANRIAQHLQLGMSLEHTTVALRGYLSALGEFGLISPEAHGRLTDMLPKQWGVREALELALGPEGSAEFLQPTRED